MSLREINEEIDINVGNTINRIRTQQGLSMRHLAKISGVSQPHISQLEKGNRSITLKLLLDICNALGITLDEFTKGLELKSSETSCKVDENLLPEYNRLCHLAKLLDHQELKIVLQVMEKLFENRTARKSDIVLSEYLELVEKEK